MFLFLSLPVSDFVVGKFIHSEELRVNLLYFLIKDELKPIQHDTTRNK